MKKLSIIIPVYGVEKYIEECISSICCQMELDVEVIIINDGTQDRSIEIAKNVVSSLSDELQNCFIFLEQINQGQSVARNHGISKSTGEFIAFVDPDDFVYANYFQTLLKEISENPLVDVFHINAKKVDEDSREVNDSIKIAESNEFIQNDKSYLERLFKLDAWQPWLRIFNSKFKDELIFPSGILMEDKYLFASLYANKIKNIKAIDREMIGYRVHGSSSLNDPKNSNLLILSARKGIEKYSEYYGGELDYIYLSYLNLYVFLNSSQNFFVILKNFKKMKIYYHLVLNRDDLSLKKSLMHKYPTIYTLLLRTKKFFYWK